MSQTLYTSIAVVGIDIGKNSFHLVGQDQRGSIVLRQKWSRGQVERGSRTGANNCPCQQRPNRTTTCSPLRFSPSTTAIANAAGPRVSAHWCG